MNHRWYEEDTDLKELVSFIEALDSDNRVVVASHLLQILVNECGIDLDKEFSEISQKDYSYNRWYDDDIDLSTSLELIKSLSENKKGYVVKRFLSEIVMAYAKEEM